MEKVTCDRCKKHPPFYLILTNKETQDPLYSCVSCFTTDQILEKIMVCQLCQSKTAYKQKEGIKKDIWLCDRCCRRWDFLYAKNCSICEIELSEKKRHYKDYRTKKGGAICSDCFDKRQKKKKRVRRV